MRKPDPDDLCICGHARYAHLALTDGCTLCEETCAAFKLRLTYRIAVETWLDNDQCEAAYVSRALYADLVHIVSPMVIFGGVPQTFLGKPLLVDDSLTDRELRFTQDGQEERVVLA